MHNDHYRMKINGVKHPMRRIVQALTRGRLLSALLAFAASGLAFGAAPELAFPDALGWAAHTPGGRGGKIIRVTMLAAFYVIGRAINRQSAEGQIVGGAIQGLGHALLEEGTLVFSVQWVNSLYTLPVFSRVAICAALACKNSCISSTLGAGCESVFVYSLRKHRVMAGSIPTRGKPAAASGAKACTCLLATRLKARKKPCTCRGLPLA
mgnify:CR=1 FL=1